MRLPRASVGVITCIVDDERYVLLIRRPESMRAFPGFWGLPGGKIDSNDLEGVDPAMTALVREVEEEVGLSLDVSKVSLIGTALAPEINPWRFKTSFYHCPINEKVALKLQKAEVEEAVWLKASMFEEWYAKGDIAIVPPVRDILMAMAMAANQQVSLPSDLSPKVKEGEVPSFEFISKLEIIAPLSPTIPPAKRTNCLFLKAQGLLVDPSPIDESELLKFRKTLADKEVQGVIISHHHPDHHRFCEVICEDLEVPCYMTEKTHWRLLKQAPRKFEKVRVKYIKEGDSFGNDGELRVIELPGHDDGMIGLMDKNWLFVADLIHGLTTVVIPEEEGNMGDYLSSLQRVLELDFKYIIPSHGIPLGGKHKVLQTYNHRLSRHKEVVSLLEKGLNDHEITLNLYPDLNARIFKYALENVRGHIRLHQQQTKEGTL